MKEIRFDPTGGRLSAEVTCGQAQEGAYELRLWAAEDNTMILQEHGNFLNPADDEYPLPQPARVNDRRIVQALVVVVLTPPIDQYSVALIVKQDGRELDRVSLDGRSDESSVALNVFLPSGELRGGPMRKLQLMLAYSCPDLSVDAGPRRRHEREAGSGLPDPRRLRGAGVPRLHSHRRGARSAPAAGLGQRADRRRLQVPGRQRPVLDPPVRRGGGLPGAPDRGPAPHRPEVPEATGPLPDPCFPSPPAGRMVRARPPRSPSGSGSRSGTEGTSAPARSTERPSPAC